VCSSFKRLGWIATQDPIKLAALTYSLKYALTHMGCKKHHKIHLRQASHAVSWVGDNTHNANRSGEDSPSPDEAEDVVEVVEFDSDGGTLDQSGEGPTSPDEAEDVEVDLEVGSGDGAVHLDVQSRAAEAVGSDPVAGDGPGTSTGHAQIVDLQGVGEVRTCSINQCSSYNDPVGMAGGWILRRRNLLRPRFQQDQPTVPTGTSTNLLHYTNYRPAIN
jgi:hypothetical protein